MRACALPALLWICASSVGVADTSSRPATTAPAAADKLAAEGLSHAARSLGHVRDDAVVARAGRIRALLRYAHSIWPENVRTNRQLVDLYEGLGEAKLAAAAADRYLHLRPHDHAAGVRWMRLAQATLSAADERIALLKGATDRKEFPPGTRARAWGELCGIYLRQGEKAEAAAACEQALALDPFESTALRAQARLKKQPSPVDDFTVAIGLFRSNPRSLRLAWKPAQMLQAAGAYPMSMEFYKQAYAVASDVTPARKVMETLLLDYVNAMLDAGRAAEAVAFFEPLMKDYGYNLGLRALIVEALRVLKRDDDARSQVAFMVKVYEPLSTRATKATPQQAAELGWFALTYRSQPQAALEWTKAAALSARDDPFVQRVMGAAELAVGNVGAGTSRLAALVDKDVFAAAILARHYYATGKPRMGRQVLLGAPASVRTGPAWRQLAAIASQHKVDLPPVPHAEAMVRAAKKIPTHFFELGRSPERFVAVRLSALPEKVAPGEPVAVRVELENVSERPVSLGPDGLFAPVVFLSVAVDGKARAKFEELTPVQLPVPKYLSPGQEVSEIVRLDVGPAEQFLMAHPLAELKLTVSAKVDPLQRGKEMISSVPALSVLPITIRRPALFDVSKGETAARYALGYIVRDLKGGDLRTQLRAARQTASLLAHVRNVESGRARAIFPEVLTKPVLLSMMRAFLQGRSPVLRAEMLGSLHHVDLDERIIGLLGPNVQDGSALVRMRLIELLAGKRTRGYEALLELFAKDSSAAVRDMAAAVSDRK